MRILDKIVTHVGRRIDESSPMVDARLSDGSRVNAIIPPLAVDGPILSIRRFSVDKLMPPDLVERKSMTQGMMELLEAAVKAKLNIVVSGGTGSGKTTLLNALSVFINHKERIITIEDTAGESQIFFQVSDGSGFRIDENMHTAYSPYRQVARGRLQ
jgi:pilus assembly protein CpaF